MRPSKIVAAQTEALGGTASTGVKSSVHIGFCGMSLYLFMSYLVHIGLVVTMNLEIGLITPPVGFNLYVGSSLSQLSLYEVMRAAIPIMAIIGIALFLYRQLHTTYRPFFA